VGEYRFLNQMQPQTLVIATLFCYIDAVFSFLSFAGLGFLLALGLGLGGFGIANEKKWGYAVAVAAAIVQVAFVLTAGTDAFRFPLILNLIFDGALVALLLHPASREYQRIWFK
jgi:hypothetical protein